MSVAARPVFHLDNHLFATAKLTAMEWIQYIHVSSFCSYAFTESEHSREGTLSSANTRMADKASACL